MNNWLTFLTLLIFSISCGKNNDLPDCSITDEQHIPEYRGVSYESPPNPVGTETFDSVDEVGANSVSIIPFGFITNTSSEVLYNVDGQWWGETEEGVIELVQFAQEHNKTIMLKPQIWIWGGAFTGDYEPASEEDWELLEESYLEFILFYADLAEELNCELFCIGMELKKFHQQRPDYWSNLIDSVELHYSGKLTYAGNWDSYTTFAHWDKLDYIGIDAYFPITGEATPTVQDCLSGWENWMESIQEHQNSIDLPIIFTEYGYRSVNFCANEPWDSSSGGIPNMDAQVNAYSALYEKFWDQPWFEGGFLWKWKAIDSTSGGLSNTQFTPQNKPVEEIIQQYYSN